MARKTQLVSLTTNTEINLTSLMDLTFILLMYFIITFPMMDNGIPMNLPSTPANKALDRENSVNVTIDAAGLLFLDNAPVGFDALGARLSEIRTSRPNAVFLVRADAELQYDKLAKVLSAMNSAKISKLALVTKVDPKAKPPTP